MCSKGTSFSLHFLQHNGLLEDKKTSSHQRGLTAKEHSGAILILLKDPKCHVLIAEKYKAMPPAHMSFLILCNYIHPE